VQEASVSSHTTLIRNAHVVSRRASEWVVLLHITDGTYYTLNDVGGRVWELCDGTRTIAEITSIVAEEYDAPLEVVQSDVTELVEELCAERLVAPRPEATCPSDTTP
jgi:pyrroloquinoline quinone biosynthesis protein D